MKQKETIGRRRFLPLMLLMILCLTAILPACSPKPEPEDENFEIPETDPYTEKLPAPVTAAYEVAAAGAALSGNAALLSDGKTVFLPRGEGNAMEITVTAAHAGYYALYTRYNACKNYVHYYYAVNLSGGSFAGINAVGRIEKEGDGLPVTGNEDYRVADSTAFALTQYIYLVSGENRIKFYITGSEDKSDIGIAALRFDLVGQTYPENVSDVFASDAVASDCILATSGSAGSTLRDGTSNGGFFRPGSRVALNVTIPESGVYRMEGLISSGGTTLTLTEKDKTAVLAVTSIPRKNLGNCSTAAEYVSGIASLYLTAGMHTLYIDVADGWFHFANLRFTKTADYPDRKNISVVGNGFTYDAESGKFTLNVNVNGTTTRPDKTIVETVTVRLYGRSGNTLSEKVYSKTANDLTENYSAALAKNLDYVKADITFSDRRGKTIGTDTLTYDTADRLHILFITDTHYTGTNALDPNGKEWKWYNHYTYEYDVYGWTSDEKLQQLMDQILEEDKRDPVDMVFFLGDCAMNDGNYRNYCDYHESYSGKNGETLDDFFDEDCMLNISRIVKEKFYDQLTAAGIPYFVANGNHDYCMRLGVDENGNEYLDYSAWEAMYHYEELFGFTKTSYVVRAVNRNGELKIVTNLSDARLAEFWKQGYTWFINDEKETDKPLVAIPIVDGFGLETYKKYLHYNPAKDGDYTYQTFRYEGIDPALLYAMMEKTVGCPAVYLAGHLVGSSEEAVVDCIRKYGVQAVLYGDVHTQESYTLAGVPKWCVGQFSVAYDMDRYYTPDGEPDNQYYYDRGNPKLSNVTWGDMTRHPWSYVSMEIYGGVGKIERVQAAYYYENGAQTRLTYNTITGDNVKYRHYLDENGKTVYDQYGNPVYVDGNGTPVYRVVDKDAAGRLVKRYFYRDTDGEFVYVDLAVDATYTDLMKSETQKDQYYVGDFEPEIVIENGEILCGEGWLLFTYVSHFVYEDGSAAEPATVYGKDGNPVLGFDMPYYRFETTWTNPAA